jgi:hypothetical protein
MIIENNHDCCDDHDGNAFRLLLSVSDAHLARLFVVLSLTIGRKRRMKSRKKEPFDRFNVRRKLEPS